VHARGWPAAKTFFEKGFREKGEHSPRTALRLLAWDYWDERLTDATADYWPAACRQMKTLLADERELDTPENRRLLKSLEAALLLHGNAKPGSVEALVDDLINVRDTPYSDERFVRVLDLGFEAVPALLERLDDDRLTRYRKPAWNVNISFMPAYHYRLCDMASDLLRLFAGEDAARHWPIDRNDRAAQKLLIKDWWDEARRQGEEAYLLAHVIPSTCTDESPEEGWPDQFHARLLGKKYPRRLASLYRGVLENHPRMQSWPLADAVADSSLSRKEKVELLVLATGNKSLEHRRPAFWLLKDLDAERFVSLLAATLDDLPRTPTAPYDNCCESNFATLACNTDDPRVWRALGRAARRADPGLRMEMLRNTNYPTPTATQRRRRLAFLASFLEDDAVRDATANQKMFNGIYAGFRFPRLEIRNFAALRISEILETPADPTPEWKAEQWAKLRDQMRAALKREPAEDAKE